MSDTEIRKLLKELITSNLPNVFRLSRMRLKDTSKQWREVILLEAQFNQAEDAKRVGTISEESYNLSINKIRASLISLIDDIKKEDLVSSFADSQSVKKFRKEKDEFEQKLQSYGLKRKLKGSKRKEIYSVQYDKFLSVFEDIFKKYCEMGDLELQAKTVDKGMIFKVDVATVRIIPCVDNSKKFLWICFDFEGKKRNENLKSLGIFELDYSEDMKLIWRNRENRKLTFKDEELAEIVAKEVFEMIMDEE